ncbi:nucleotidyltransferase family protein [Sulfurisphaera javensis]|uniref:nucleotidyltransferase family protein n=1 Tax=Sulfurisphaera javensis TaxID=2049879 RepID=UPI0034E88525
MFKLSEVYDKLKKFNWSDYNIYYAVLFGSLAKKGEGNDIDIAVEFKNTDLEAYTNLFISLTDYLQTEKVDLVMVTDDTSCYLVHEIFNDSLILYLENYDRIHRKASICEDFLIDARKLNLIDNAGKVLLRKW